MAVAQRMTCAKLIRVFARWADDGVIARTLDFPGDDLITPAQFRCLEFLAHQERCSIGDVADGLAISDPAATKLVDRLESKGLVARHNDRVDRRVVHVELSGTGQGLAQKLNHRRADIIESAIQGLTSARLRSMARALEGVLISALDSPEVIARVCLRCGDGHSPDCVVNRAHMRVTGVEIGWL
jgi:DNA-binding MarR family transcriptional regulator